MKILYPKHIVQRALPKNLEQKDLQAFEKEIVREIDECKVLELKNMYITPQGVIWDNSWRNVKEVDIIEGFDWRYKLSCFFKSKKIKLPNNEKYLLAFDAWSHGYFHWFADTMTRIGALADRLHEYILLLPNKLNSFQEKSLSIFNFKAIYQIPSDSYIYVQYLIVPTYTALTGNYNEIIVQEIRSLYQTKYNFTNQQPAQERIYISRGKAKRRYVSNEDKLKPILEKYHFKVVYLEDYSFEEQIKLMQSTKYLISIHGAALTNMLFMSEKSKVMELRKEGDNSNLCYFSLASTLNIDYYYQFGTVTNQKIATYDADIAINARLLEQNICFMLEQ
ncbi:hypothetical protein AD998_05920 [bacterium 336/3]|nr:hypothetical protein AD998_05920 [bacterium 336/3]